MQGLLPEKPHTSPNPLSWYTPNVTLTADDFYILADGVKYYADVQVVDQKSDPGFATYTTLEATWIERGVEQRMNLYFAADSNNWWVSGIRTYDGQVDPEWIYYPGDGTVNDPHYFQSSLGTPFTGNVSLVAGPANQFAGQIHFTNVYLIPYFRIASPSPFPSPSTIASIIPSASPTSAPIPQVNLKLKLEGIARIRSEYQLVNITFKKSDGTLIEKIGQVVGSDTNGIFSTLSPMSDIQLTWGTYQIYVSGPIHLTKSFSVAITEGIQTIDLTGQTLTTGDVMHNNYIDTSDYGRVVSSFGCKKVPPVNPLGKDCSLLADADLDGDVDIFDYAYIIGNYGQVGEQ